MELFKRAFLLVVVFTAVNGIFAQNSTTVTVEIQNIERAIGRQDISAGERHISLVRLAQLRQLSGDLEGAARNWLEAAVAIPNIVDDNALLSCAYCLAAIGEWERASAALNPLLTKFPRAQFLQTSIDAWVSGDISELVVLSVRPEYSQMKSEIYFMLWKIANGSLSETWKQRLIEEFPQSPEGRIAAAEQSSSVITIKISPFWLFINGRDTFFLMETASESSASEQVTPVESVVHTARLPTQESERQDFVRLQTGLFNRQINAQVHIEQLRKAGFSSVIEQRTIGESEMWIVTVLAGQDVNRSIRDLKNAGFDAFPLVR